MHPNRLTSADAASKLALATLQDTTPVSVPATLVPLKLISNQTAHVKPPTYELRGVVDHEGSLQGGHYTARCRSATDNTWYLCDDRTVKSTQYDGAPSPMPYVLFYRRKD